MPGPLAVETDTLYLSSMPAFHFSHTGSLGYMCFSDTFAAGKIDKIGRKARVLQFLWLCHKKAEAEVGEAAKSEGNRYRCFKMQAEAVTVPGRLPFALSDKAVPGQRCAVPQRKAGKNPDGNRLRQPLFPAGAQHLRFQPFPEGSPVRFVVPRKNNGRRADDRPGDSK